MKMDNLLHRLGGHKQKPKKPLDVLLSTPNIGRLTEDERKHMTVSCRDTEYIPKVKGAGRIKKVKGRRVQVLHNGLLVEADGYVGPWMTDVISSLRGHHEPQEEKAFHEVLERIGKGATMIELGSYWAYYSLWFNKKIKNAHNICCEPDANNRLLGERNAALNGAKNITFLEGAVGTNHGEEIELTSDSRPGEKIKVPVLSIDGIAKDYALEKIDILHMDVQGHELEALKSSEGMIRAGALRFLFVSTHHYLFSGTPMTHAGCLSFIKDRGGHIITSHTIPESFSGDGLIVASFSDMDKDFHLETSLNHTDQSLFRSYEEDIQILTDYYTK